MDIIRLVFPSMEMEQKAEKFKQKFFSNGEQTINGSWKLDQNKYSYVEWLEMMQNNLHTETANPKFGVSETFFAVDGNEEIVGIVSVRYDLTPFYKDSGHIGYSVAPGERRKGYGTQMLKLALEKAKQKGLTEVKLVCREDNIASKKIILNSGGERIRTFEVAGVLEEEYLIGLEKVYSRCGMRCDLCLVYRPNVEKEDRREEICKVFGKIWNGFEPNPKEIICDGCLAAGEDAVLFSPGCQTRECVMKKKLEHCGYCSNYPCEIFPAEPTQEETVQKIEVEKQWTWEDEKLMEAYACKKNMDEFRRLQSGIHI